MPSNFPKEIQGDAPDGSAPDGSAPEGSLRTGNSAFGSNPQDNLNCKVLVLGGGALGLPVAAHLSEMFAVEVVSKSNPMGLLCTNFEISLYSQIASTSYTLPIVTEEQIRSGQWKIPFHCTELLILSLLPAEVADQATLSLVDALLTVRASSQNFATRGKATGTKANGLQSSNWQTSLTVVMGNNGMCELSKWQYLADKIVFIRALFTTGFSLSKIDGKKIVTYSGGNLVSFSQINLQNAEGTQCEQTDSASFEHWRRESQERINGIFKPEFQPQIVFKEFEKFFVNFMLALFAGPARVSNGAALNYSNSAVGLGRFELWSTAFASFWRKKYPCTDCENALAIKFRAAFAQITSNTHLNLNSVSAAAVKGNNSTFAYFFLWSANMLQELGVVQESQWREELQNVSKQWDLTR